MPNKIVAMLFRTFLEGPAKGKSFGELSGKLDDSGQTISARLVEAADTPQNRQQLGHVIGIERWGQHRLRSLLGETMVLDEYDSYRPDAALDMTALRKMFVQTRAESVALVASMQQQRVNLTARVMHNMAGELSVAGWLNYLKNHAEMESKGIH
jgi:hypothetical protein